eukprot:scaffold1187_cov181-Ochromonas_danica.AAC.20
MLMRNVKTSLQDMTTVLVTGCPLSVANNNHNQTNNNSQNISANGHNNQGNNNNNNNNNNNGAVSCSGVTVSIDGTTTSTPIPPTTTQQHHQQQQREMVGFSFLVLHHDTILLPSSTPSSSSLLMKKPAEGISTSTTNTTMISSDVWIVDHPTDHTLEVIASFENKESRLYLHRSELLTRYHSTSSSTTSEQNKKFPGIIINELTSAEKEWIISFIIKRLHLRSDSNNLHGYPIFHLTLLSHPVSDHNSSVNKKDGSNQKRNRVHVPKHDEFYRMTELIMQEKPHVVIPYAIPSQSISKYKKEREKTLQLNHHNSDPQCFVKSESGTGKNPILPVLLPSLPPTPSAEQPPARRQRGSVLLRSMDDNYIMECTNFVREAFDTHYATSSNDSSGPADGASSSASFSVRCSTPVTPSIKLTPLHCDITEKVQDSQPSGRNEKVKQSPQEESRPLDDNLDLKSPRASHDNHIPGLKLLKKVGSFKFSDDPEPVYARAMINKHLRFAAAIGKGNNLGQGTSKSMATIPTAVGGGCVSGGGLMSLRYLMGTKSSKKKAVRSIHAKKKITKTGKVKKTIKCPKDKISELSNSDEESKPMNEKQSNNDAVDNITDHNAENSDKEVSDSGDQANTTKPTVAEASKEPQKARTRMKNRKLSTTSFSSLPPVLVSPRDRKSAMNESNKLSVDAPTAEQTGASLHRKFGLLRDASLQYDLDKV